MSENMLCCLLTTNHSPDIQFRENMYNEVLISIENICLALAIVNKGLMQLGICVSNQFANNVYDCDLQYETYFNVNN